TEDPSQAVAEVSVRSDEDTGPVVQHGGYHLSGDVVGPRADPLAGEGVDGRLVVAVGDCSMGDEFGVDRAGMDRRHADAMAGQPHVLPERFGQPPDKGLRGAVGTLGRYADKAEFAGEVDQVAVTGGDEVG